MFKDEKTIPEFHATIEWTGGLEGELTIERKTHLLISSPPVWDGLSDRYSPQDLFVSAVTSCYLTTFGHFIKRLDQPIEALNVEGRGVLAPHPEGGYLFSDIFVIMHITIPEENARTKVKRAIDLAKKYCMVTRSVSCRVHLEARITTKG